LGRLESAVVKELESIEGPYLVKVSIAGIKSEEQIG